MRYRPEIDGLRALAVMPVIFFHAGFETFSGGYVGVDIFFVISGYLITRILCDEMQAGRLSIRQFFKRRARRILPALLVVVAACIPFAWMWMMPDEFEYFCRSIIAVNVFLSNVFFWMTTNYFGSAADAKPLLHTWSLAVEEQFYLLFPIFLLVLRRCRQHVLLAIVVALTLFSFALGEWASRTHPAAAFYLTPMRAWQIGVGCILAIVSQGRPSSPSPLGEVASLFGLFLIVYAILTYDAVTPVSGFAALIPVTGAALIIALAGPATVTGRILSVKLLTGIGMISYSAYLWHQPIFAFARIRLYNFGVSSDMYMLLILLTLLLAFLTWHHIEKPFRREHLLRGKRLATTAAAVSVALTAFAAVGILGAGLPHRLSPKTIQLIASLEALKPREAGVPAARNERMMFKMVRVDGQTEAEIRQKVAIWGDSYSRQLALDIAPLLTSKDRPLAVFNMTACLPFVGVSRNGRVNRCQEFNERVRSHILDDPDIGIVIVAGRWPVAINGDRFDNREGGKESGPDAHVIPIGEDLSFRHRPERISVVGSIFRQEIRALLDRGKRVVLIYPVPEVGWHAPLYLLRNAEFGVENNGPISTSYEVFKERTMATYEQFDRLGEHPNLIRIHPENLFCNTVLPGRCIAERNGQPLYRDEHHLNTIGASLIAERIIAELTQRGWL